MRHSKNGRCIASVVSSSWSVSHRSNTQRLSTLLIRPIPWRLPCNILKTTHNIDIYNTLTLVDYTTFYFVEGKLLRIDWQHLLFCQSFETCDRLTTQEISNNLSQVDHRPFLSCNTQRKYCRYSKRCLGVFSNSSDYSEARNAIERLTIDFVLDLLCPTQYCSNSWSVFYVSHPAPIQILGGTKHGVL